MLSVADTSLLSSAVDGIVLVVNGPHTSVGMIRETKDRIIESHGTITGIIVNRVMDGVGEYGYYEKR
jgi:Mrp family chromosome partitioning ATPase